jgi:hypothetical protein
LCEELNQVLGPDTTVIGSTALHELQIESLHIVRIRTRMSAHFSMPIRLSVLLSGNTVDAIAAAVLADGPEYPGEDGLDDMSVEELRQLLRQIDHAEGQSND